MKRGTQRPASVLDTTRATGLWKINRKTDREKERICVSVCV